MRLLLFISLISISLTGHSQNYADKEVYLVDSLEYDNISPDYQKIIDYDPYDIKLVGSPIDLVVFDGASKIREKVKSSGVRSLTGKDVVKEVVLLSKKKSDPYLKKLYKSIDEVIQNKDYEWKTAEVLEGNIQFE